MPKLSQTSVEALETKPEEFVAWDSEVIGLGVRVRPGGTKTFILTYRRGGKLRKHTMGRLQAGYGVKEARERAKELLQPARRRRPPAGQGTRA